MILIQINNKLYVSETRKPKHEDYKLEIVYDTDIAIWELHLIPVKEGDETEKFEKFAINICIDKKFYNIQEALQNGIEIPNEVVGIEKSGVFYKGAYSNTCSICEKWFHNGDKRQPICEPCCNKKVAYLITQPKKEESNEAVEFLKFVWLNKYTDNNDAQDLYNEFKLTRK